MRSSTYLDQSVDRSMSVIVKNNIRNQNNNNNKNGFFTYFLSVFLLLIIFGTVTVQAQNSREQQECTEKCAPNEYCKNGMCVDSTLLNLVLRSEEISEHNTPINAPIRIHKYNLDDSAGAESNESPSLEEREEDSQEANSDEGNSESEENSNSVEIKKRLANTVDSLWPTHKLKASRNMRKNDLLFKSSESDSNEEEDENDSEENENNNDVIYENNSSDDDDNNEYDDDEDENRDNSNGDEQDIIINRINKRNANNLKQLIQDLENEEEEDSEEMDNDSDSEENVSDSDESDDSDDDDEDDQIRISRRAISSEPKSNNEILNDLYYLLSNDENAKNLDEQEINREYNDLINKDLIMDVNFNDDGSFNIEEIATLPTEEKGILEPIVYQRETQDRDGNRYYEEDFLKPNDLIQSPSRIDESQEDLVERLPSDSAYFDIQQSSESEETNEKPKRENWFYRDPRQQSDESQEEASDESLERVQTVVVNNPFESFLESIVSPKQNYLEEQQLEKRVSVLPEDYEQIRRPRLGVIGLITNRLNRFESSEYNSPEYGSTEEERDRILALEPIRTHLWQEEQDNNDENEEIKRDQTLLPTVGLIDLLNSKAYNIGDDTSAEYEREQRAFIVTPKRDQLWSNEEPSSAESDESSYFVIQNQDSSNNEALERIRENLADEQEKFIDNLLEQTPDKASTQQKDSVQAIDQELMVNEPLSQIQDMYVEIKLKKKIEKQEAEDLLSFISHLTAIDSSLIKDLNVDGNRIWFKLDGLDNQEDLEFFVQEILNHERQIEQEKGLTIVSSNLISNPDIENIEKRKQAILSKQQDVNAKRFFLITVTACGSVLAILITLVAIFVIRRRAYLRNKLIDELNLPKKKKFDDVERLVESDYTEQSRFTKLMNKFCSYKQKNEKTDVETSTTDATTPNKDTEKILSRQSHQDYQDLCRSEEFVPSHLMTTPVTTNTEMTRKTNAAESTRSSTSSCTPSTESTTSPNSNITTQVIALPVLSEEPINNIDIDVTTGHVILSYMEDHLNEKNLVLKEWDDLSAYEADQNKSEIGTKYMAKNRYSNILPFDHNRVKLHDVKDQDDDYINASYITDDDPKNPAYIATQGPLSHTTSDFWQMVWEQNSVMIISLCRTVEFGSSKCHQYWPTNGSQVYGIFEVNLVSEHVWCEDYLVRSFYLKNLSNGLSRTVTQFHFLTWPENDLPQNFKSILDFRRKVNRSYKKKSSPVIVHCNDGVGRTGTFILIDMILNKIIKGAKEIDLAATVEYLRDQRIDMIKNKNQFEFVFAVIADEVQNMLKAQDEQ